MALYKLTLRSYRVNPIKCIIGMTKFFSDHTSSRELFAEADLMDEFTTQLVQSKSEKWAKRTLKNPVCKPQNSSFILDKSNVNLSDAHSMPIDEINMMFEEYIKNEDYHLVLRLTQECIKHKKCPKFSVLNDILTYCSQKGEKEIIIRLRDLYKALQPSMVEVGGNGYFSFFLASAIWVRGDVMKSIQLFKQVHKDNVYLRRRIRLSLRYLINDIVNCRSDAALNNIIEFCEYLAHDFNDTYPLQCIWQSCFLSEWFSDQELAIDLLERNETLCDSINSRIPYVIAVSLRSNHIEVVHRLLEFLLRSNRKAETAGLLMLLFDYHLKQNNISSCSAIMQWCKDNNVRIPGAHNEKFFKLLVKEGMSKMRKDETPKASVKYNFKF